MPKREREKNQWANQLADVIKAVKLLSRPQGASIEELEEELSIKKRTVHRLKRSLIEEFNMPLIPLDAFQERNDDQKRCNRWQLPKSATMTIPNIHKIGLNTPELLALYVLRGFAGIYKGSSIMTDIDGAFAKIGEAISQESRTMLEKYARLFVVAPKSAKSYAASADVIEELSFAIIGKKTCLATYHSLGNDTLKTYNIDPLHFFEHDGGLYLIAVITAYGDLRTLAVERFKKIEMSEDRFEYPADFDAENYLSSAFTLYFDEPETFKIRFTKDQARYIAERIWAVDQKIETKKDGSIILTMNTSGGYDVKKWILSHGSDAELLEPQWMRDEIIDEMQRGLNQYER